MTIVCVLVHERIFYRNIFFCIATDIIHWSESMVAIETRHSLKWFPTEQHAEQSILWIAASLNFVKKEIVARGRQQNNSEMLALHFIDSHTQNGILVNKTAELRLFRIN